MAALMSVACRLLKYPSPVASLGIVRKARCIIPDNGFPREISTTCKCFADDDKSGVGHKKGVKSTPDVKVLVVTHQDNKIHRQICSSLFEKGNTNKLFLKMSENKVMFRMIPIKGHIQIIARDDEKLERAEQLLKTEIEEIKKKLNKQKEVEKTKMESKTIPTVPEPAVKTDSIYTAKVDVKNGVPRTLIGLLIGKKGVNIEELEKRAGCRLELQHGPDYIEVKVTDQTRLMKAVQVVENEIQSLISRNVALGASQTRTIKVEGIERIYGLLIGKNGENLKRVKQKAGVEFLISKVDDTTLVIKGKDKAAVDVAVEEVTKEIEAIQTKFIDVVDTDVDSNLTKLFHLDRRCDQIFSRLIGKKGENINRLRKKALVDFMLMKQDDTTIVLKVKDPAGLDKAVELITKEIEAIKQTRMGLAIVPKTSIDWEKVFNGEMERLGIFEKSDLQKESPRIECPLWDKLEAEERREWKKAYPVNNFDKMINLTEEGKLWEFPINNDQGWTEEENVSFDEHVFLDHLINDFPKKGPVRHFMELVVAGLSKNPHMTVKQKHEHIEWYRTYFTENRNIMLEELGEEHSTIRNPHPHV